MIKMNEPKICSPKILKGKNLDYGQEGVAHYLRVQGILFNLNYVQDDNLNIEEFQIKFEDIKNQNAWDCGGFPEQIINQIEHLKSYLIYDAKYLNCDFKFRITLDARIELLYGIDSGETFVSFEEIECLAKDLSIGIVKPVWRGTFNPMIEHIFLENTLIQKY